MQRSSYGASTSLGRATLTLADHGDRAVDPQPPRLSVEVVPAQRCDLATDERRRSQPAATPARLRHRSNRAALITGAHLIGPSSTAGLTLPVPQAALPRRRCVLTQPQRTA